MRVPALALLAALATGPALAADLAPPLPVAPEEFEKRWQFAAGAYVWAAGLDGKVGVGGLGPANVDAGFVDVLEKLDIAFMAVAEARYDRFGVLGDVIYSHLSADGSGPRGLVDASATNSLFIGTLMGEARVVEAGRSSLDAMAGARLWSTRTRLKLSGPRGRSLRRTVSETWVDPMIGVKGRVQGDMPLYATGWAMIGGFGAAADVDWDLFAGLGYEVNDRFSVIAGYRALGVEYDRGDFLYDAIQHGPLVAGILHF